MKGILCLENVWYPDDVADGERESVAPLLRIVTKANHVRLAHFDCGTREELEHRLGTARLPDYGTLYLAFHGRPGKVGTEIEYLTLEQLAEIMGRRFKGWNVHVGSCLSMRLPPSRILSFKRAIGARQVSGYKKWTWLGVRDYDALEVAWMYALVSGRRRLPRYYAGLVRKSGLVIV